MINTSIGSGWRGFLCKCCAVTMTVAGWNATDAATVVFPDKDGSGDLSSADAWGGGVTDPANIVQFNHAKSETFTASEDITFGGFLFSKTSTNNASVFDMRNETTGGSPRKIRLNGSVAADQSKNAIYVRGGMWNVTGSWSPGWAKPSFYTYFRDGAVVNIGGTLGGAYGAGPSLIQLAGGSVVTAQHARAQFNQGSNGAIEVLGGSQLIVTGTGSDSLRSNMTNGTNCGYRVSGRGSLIKRTSSKNATSIGHGDASGHCYLIVEDHAELQTPGAIFVGTAERSGHNLLRVTGEAKIRCSSVHVGQGAGAHHNLAEVMDGGELEVSSVMYVGGLDYDKNTNNEFVVSNGIYRGPVPEIGHYAGSSNCVVRLIGKKTVFDTSATVGDASLFGKAAYNRFEMDDAVWTNNTSKLCVNSTQATPAPRQCVFELRNDSEYYTTNSFALNGINYDSYGQTVSICSGSRLYSGGNLSVWSRDNVFSVSNGTLETASNFDVTTLSRSEVMPGGFSNNWVKVAGDSPLVSVTNGTFTLTYSSYLQFDYPRTGYAVGVVPVRVKNFTVDNGTGKGFSEIFVNGLENRVAEIERTETVPLISATGKITIPDATLEAANARLPEKCRLTVSADKKQLLLKVWKRAGLVLILH